MIISTSQTIMLSFNDILLLGLGVTGFVWSVILVGCAVYLDTSQRARATDLMNDAFRVILSNLADQRRKAERTSANSFPAE